VSLSHQLMALFTKTLDHMDGNRSFRNKFLKKKNNKKPSISEKKKHNI